MNSLSNFTTLYNHSEPILSLPDSGKCSLLTGIEKGNLTADVFQPCCSEAAPVGFERSTYISFITTLTYTTLSEEYVILIRS